MEHLWNDIEKRQFNYSKKNVPSAAFATINPSLTGLESNPGLRGERPTTKRLSRVQMFVLQASYLVPRQCKQVYYYLGRSLRCRFGDMLLVRS